MWFLEKFNIGFVRYSDDFLVGIVFLDSRWEVTFCWGVFGFFVFFYFEKRRDNRVIFY